MRYRVRGWVWGASYSRDSSQPFSSWAPRKKERKKETAQQGPHGKKEFWVKPKKHLVDKITEISIYVKITWICDKNKPHILQTERHLVVSDLAWSIESFGYGHYHVLLWCYNIIQEIFLSEFRPIFFWKMSFLLQLWLIRKGCLNQPKINKHWTD